MEPRQNLWLLYKEMIVNAVKHSRCTEMKIILTSNDTFLRLKIEDNGIGFDPQALSDGRGITNLRERAALLNAQLNLQTSPGHGTQWEMTCSF